MLYEGARYGADSKERGYVLRQFYLRNSMTGKKESFQSLEEGKVRIYGCGVTVYGECHIGHAMQAIFFDVIRNFFEYCGYDVTYVRNFTDVDDKIINRARELNISPAELVERMIESTQEDMKALKIRPANQEPRVTETIPEIIEMIQSLVKKGYAYSTDNGDVYYKVEKKSDYGKLSNRKPEELLSGTREINATEKENSLDFALWKNDEVEGASWDSPWGKGRPGWHIECSVMARKFLGKTFDIHGGGRDLIFPHHENEIAQSEAANGQEFARYWMHNGLLTINHQKMSKSLGNMINIQDFLKDWHPEVLRYAFLQNHYTSNVDFSEGVFANCRKRLFYFYKTLGLLDKLSLEELPEATEAEKKELQKYEEDFMKAMCDDFNSPMAFGSLSQMAKWGNLLASRKKHTKIVGELSKTLKKLCSSFRILEESPEDFIQSHKTKILKELNLTEKDLLDLIRQRQEAREAKNWKESDRIRDLMTEKGIVLQDGVEGTTWSLSNL